MLIMIFLLFGERMQMNLEYFAIDSQVKIHLLCYFLIVLIYVLYFSHRTLVISLIQGFVTDNDKALEELCGKNVDNSCKYNACLNTMATRIATTFASLKV